MVIKRLIKRFRTQDWAALVSELVIVIVGIFIAVQADRWLEQREVNTALWQRVVAHAGLGEEKWCRIGDSNT